MRGAAFLSGIEDALVVDVGGTTLDVGCLKAGFPREANNVVEIGGVRTLFRMPDLLSMGLRGGTLIGDGVSIGPQSVGFRLTEKALVFGGDTLTATDVAVASGLTELGDATKVRSLDRALVDTARGTMAAMIEEGVDRMKTDVADTPLIAVGRWGLSRPRAGTGYFRGRARAASRSRERGGRGHRSSERGSRPSLQRYGT